MTSVVVKSVDERGVRRAMEAFAGALLVRPDVDEVVVFGSFERGTYAPGSDLDVLIVLRESALPPWERAAEFRPAHFPVPLDLFPFTREELARHCGTPFAAALSRSRWRYRRGASRAEPPAPVNRVP